MILFGRAVVTLFLWLFLVPLCLGMPFAAAGVSGEEKTTVPGNRLQAGIALVCGYIEMWALFQLIAVGFILTTGSFDSVALVFGGLSLAGAAAGAGLTAFRIKSAKESHGGIRTEKWRSLPWKITNRTERFHAWAGLAVWCLFLGLVLYQVIMGGLLAFADGDDAYYIPISVTTEASGTMYRTVPYTGESTQLDVRHGLAPFPIWIAFLSRVSGLHATILAQSILGGVLLLVCYCIYGQIAKLLFAGQKEGIPYFMLFLSLLWMFGNTSFYTAETFLITRTSQGKAVLGNLVLPFLFWCLLRLGQEYRMERQEREESAGKVSGKGKALLWSLVVLTSAASWLCSTLGTFLCAALIGICGLVMAAAYRNIRVILCAACCVLVNAGFAVVYMWVQV